MTTKGNFSFILLKNIFLSMNTLTLLSPLKSVLHTNEKFLKVLREHKMETLEDFLLNFPREYEDRSTFTEISEIRADQKNVILGRLTGVRREKTARGFSLVKATFTEEKTKTPFECVWFNSRGLEKTLPQNEVIMLIGKAKLNYGKVSFSAPLIEKYDGSNSFGDIASLYSDHSFIKGTWFQKKFSDVIYPLLKHKKVIVPNVIPTEIITKKNLLTRREAFLELHFPTHAEKTEQARETFAFEELFVLQIASLLKKEDAQNRENLAGENPEISLNPQLISDFFKTLPFTPTNAQKIALFEILKDFEKNVPMQRLLEGDVGSGKTLVALVACISMMQKNFQCAILAPTEILASQHVSGIQKFLDAAEISGFFEKHNFPEKTNSEDMFAEKKHTPKIEFLSGSVKGKKRQKILENLKREGSEKIDLLIGTHAILEDPVIFKNLGFVVIDEQHRFGVMQREKLLQKGNPHFLQMSATPIPRTLAIVAFGDQDISVLNELPPGRKPITTKVVTQSARRTIELFIDDQIEKGRQAFVICPLVEESEHFDEVKSATEEFLRLEEHIFPHRKIQLLHGRMKPAEKDEIMNDFKNKKFDILVSTSVVEVGVDVPNSTIMMIEGAERFGLSQLHQFRGRVGRGAHQSYCFLATSNDKANARLSAMENTQNGFELAEIDMNLRGSGEVFGVKQSGLPDLRMANLMDGRLVVDARKEAEQFLDVDAPEISGNSKHSRTKINKYQALQLAVHDRESRMMSQ